MNWWQPKGHQVPAVVLPGTIPTPSMVIPESTAVWGLGKAHPEGTGTHSGTNPAWLGSPGLCSGTSAWGSGGAGEPRRCHQRGDVVVALVRGHLRKGQQSSRCCCPVEGKFMGE